MTSLCNRDGLRLIFCFPTASSHRVNKIIFTGGGESEIQFFELGRPYGQHLLLSKMISHVICSNQWKIKSKIVHTWAGLASSKGVKVTGAFRKLNVVCVHICIYEQTLLLCQLLQCSFISSVKFMSGELVHNFMDICNLRPPFPTNATFI